jgi:hypothetical protein
MQYSLEKSHLRKYQLKIKTPHENVIPLFKSIEHILNCNSKIINDDSLEMDTIDLLPFRYNIFLGDYRKNVILVWNLIKQQEFLEKHGYSFYSFSPEEDIIWDNKNTFFIANPMRILPIKNKFIHFDMPFDKRNLFCSPELLNVCSLPNAIHYKTIYYSIASFVIYNMLNKVVKNSRSANYIEDIETNDILDPIKYTKLYWLLVKMLHDTPERRQCLFV